MCVSFYMHIYVLCVCVWVTDCRCGCNLVSFKLQLPWLAGPWPKTLFLGLRKRRGQEEEENSAWNYPPPLMWACGKKFLMSLCYFEAAGKDIFCSVCNLVCFLKEFVDFSSFLCFVVTMLPIWSSCGRAAVTPFSSFSYFDTSVSFPFNNIKNNIRYY